MAYIQQLYTNCLAQGAYYIESDGEAAIIDPMRDVQPYIDLASSRNAKIKYVFETHFHADFVSGHVDLAKLSGAEIIFGPTSMQTGYQMTVGKDGQEFSLGNCSIRLIHTPGHTMESSCYLLLDEQGAEKALFTGDTLFLGDVGRPDLAQKVIAELTREKLAAHLFDSLRNKILPLSDDLIVYPGHGAGSACGKKLSDESQDSLGNQKKTNYALNPAFSKDEFMDEVLNGLTPPPGYFPQNVLMNIGGYQAIEHVMARGLTKLNADAFQFTAETEQAIILDVRNAEDFAKGFIPGSINVGLNGSFASWVGTIIPDVKQKLLVVADRGKEEEAVRRLARVGFEHCMGYLDGGMSAWRKEDKPIDRIQTITAETFATLYAKGDLNMLDVRRESEYKTEHVVGVQNIPLDYVRDHIAEIDPEKTYYVHCAAGYRSMIFNSYLRTLGYKNLIDVLGGFKAIKTIKTLPLTEYHEQNTAL
jgi:hydroxyacylglutathione hydrolase